MKSNLFLIFLFLFIACRHKQPAAQTIATPAETVSEPAVPVYKFIGEIKTPAGFNRIPVEENSFTAWLRKVPLKSDKTVYLYNGEKKRNQLAQFAVIDIPTGNKDLQQCADVIMRLRAEYLLANKMYSDIAFMDYAGKWYRWGGADNRVGFDNYLQKVFGMCGSASLEKQLKKVSHFNAIQPGDVLIQGGFPGHAVIVADMATDKNGKKMYLLVQGYQPAQDMHVLVNRNNPELSPWYEISEEENIYTPEWHFKKADLKTW